MLKTTGNSTWTTDAGPIDALADLKDLEGRSVPYEDLLTRSIVRGRDFEVLVASVADIIAAKNFADRGKDREALAELLVIQERKHSQRYERYEYDVAFEVHEDLNRDIEP